MAPIIGILASSQTANIVTSSFESIATATGTGSSGTITFSSIPSTYTHLQLRIVAQTDSGNASRSLYLQVNNDTGTNYTRHDLIGDGSAVSASGSTSQTSIGNYTIAGSADTNIVGVSIIDIHNYASTTQNKTFRLFTGFDNNSTSGRLSLRSGLWLNTSAINKIDLFNPTDNFTTKTVVSLYGIK